MVDFSIYDFIDAFIEPVWNVAVMILSYPLFGAPLWQHILSLFLISFVIGFIVNHTVGIGFGGLVGGIAQQAETRIREANRDPNKLLNDEKTYYDRKYR